MKLMTFKFVVLVCVVLNPIKHSFDHLKFLDRRHIFLSLHLLFLPRHFLGTRFSHLKN